MALIRCSQTDPKTGRECGWVASEQMLRAKGLRCPGCGQPVAAVVLERLGLAGREEKIRKAAAEAEAIRARRKR